MHYFFLDVVDVVPAVSGQGPGLVFFVLIGITILAEGALMWMMKYNRMGKSMLDALLVNGASLAAGFLLFEFLPRLFSSITLVNLLALFLITVLIEGILLGLLNQTKASRQTWLTAILMNILSYLLFYVFIQVFAR